MAISALPPSTIHLLGSAQTLTTPFSLVKELVDNALDARATSVDVILSKDTLEKIEVRDNGQGIFQDDLDALGRRGYTSKLRSFDELRAIGGNTLGFRGEALASAVQLGEVMVTTKTEGEAVATCVVLKSSGGILKQQRISHPVGTTICVKRFSYKIPVRKQTALKAAPKTLVRIKELLQSFAFARPNVKFSLKVTKETRGSWSFIPCAGEVLREAAVQIIGKEAAAECVRRILSFSEHKPENGMEEDDFSSAIVQSEDHHAPLDAVFAVQMFLPRPGAEVTKLSHGQYISIDSRPVASDKGTMKRIVTIFKSYLKSSCSGTQENIRNPFLRMNIDCPASSYDPNVEPAKDDVIFSNEHWILESIEEFFKSFYGGLKTNTKASANTKTLMPVDDFKLLLSRTPRQSVGQGTASIPDTSSPEHAAVQMSEPLEDRDTSFHVTEEDASGIDDDEILSISDTENGTKWIVDLSEDMSERVVQQNSRQTQSFRPESPSISTLVNQTSNKGLNPFVIARLTATRSRTVEQQDLPALPDGDRSIVDPLPTPQQSSDPLTPTEFMQQALSSSCETLRRSSLDLDLCVGRSDANGSELFVPEETGPNQPRRTSINHVASGELERDRIYGSHNRREHAGNATSANSDSERVTSIPESVKLQRQVNRRINKPFVPPLMKKKISSQEGLHQTTLLDMYSTPRSSGTSEEPREQTQDPDLDWAMDFEIRKEELARQQRQKMMLARARTTSTNHERGDELTSTRTSPHKNRYLAAVSQLDDSSESAVTTERFESVIQNADPRSYLIRHKEFDGQQPAAAGKPNTISRTKSTRLPLERIPANSQLHSLALNIHTSCDLVEKLAFASRSEDLYITCGSLTHGLQMDGKDKNGLMQSLQSLLSEWKRDAKYQDVELEFNFDNLLVTET